MRKTRFVQSEIYVCILCSCVHIQSKWPCFRFIDEHSHRMIQRFVSERKKYINCDFGLLRCKHSGNQSHLDFCPWAFEYWIFTKYAVFIKNCFTLLCVCVRIHFCMRRIFLILNYISMLCIIIVIIYSRPPSAAGCRSLQHTRIYLCSGLSFVSFHTFF